MPRSRRLLLHGEGVYYHLISRTVGQEFLLDTSEKEHLMSLFSHFSSVYFVDLVGFTILDNHFHMLVKSQTANDYSIEEIDRRVKVITNNKKLSSIKQLETVAKLENISEYMKSIKETFSKWYNKKHDRKGYFWSDRFKSILLESGNAVMQCLAYIDLNAVRAKIVELPEKYRWCSIAARKNSAPISKNMSFGGLYRDADLSSSAKLKLYRRYLYACGVHKKCNKGSIPKELAEIEENLGFEIPANQLLISKVRYFTEGLAIGTEGFIKDIYSKFHNNGIYKKSQKIFETELSQEIMSLQKLRVLTS